jgi:co-chaperonin GroES (HSP10)
MIVPTGNRILVKPDPVETKTKSGLILQIDEKIAAAASVTGTLVSMGEVAWKEFVDGVFKSVYEPYASIGDRIQFRRYTGVTVRDPDTEEEYILMNDSDVLSRFEKGE